MKLFNQQKLKRLKALAPLLLVLRLLRLIFLPVAWLARLRKRPDFLVADGFLIGDCVLLRPMIAAMLREGRVVYLGGSHAREILWDMDVTFETFQWPWANYNYSIRKLLGLIGLWFRILILQPRTIVEPRGDVRSLAFLYLTCPRRLAGFSFTGGHFMLDVDPELSEVVHLEEHNRVLSKSLGLRYSIEDMFCAPEPGNGSVAISFSGSQPLRAMPTNVALALLGRLKSLGVNMSYLKGPGDFFLKNPENLAVVAKFNIPILEGTFSAYINALKNASGYVGMDSGGGHLAAMMQKPSIIFFSTQHSWYCGPRGKDTQAVETDEILECRPCAGITCTNERYLRCLEIPDARLQQVVYEFKQKLDRA
ncbi:MAG: hypothetical protein K8S54_10835 [Spirochaetia bacterium]|nr:hypothetical protein [Spirochaetia bacterium]